MPFEMSRDEYHARYGLTTGDTLRLGDTNLFIHIEHDYTSMEMKYWQDLARQFVTD